MAAGRKTGGRQAGTPNKITADIKALAMQHAPAAMKELARLAIKAESEAARVAAIKELFDRGFGKAKQSVEFDGSLSVTPMPTVIEFVAPDVDVAKTE